MLVNAIRGARVRVGATSSVAAIQHHDSGCHPSWTQWLESCLQNMHTPPSSPVPSLLRSHHTAFICIFSILRLSTGIRRTKHV